MASASPRWTASAAISVGLERTRLRAVGSVTPRRSISLW
jgi:hypothetical protein